MTPIRRLDGISYWVIDDPADIEEYVHTILRKEWEGDLRSESKDPADSYWLADLLKRHWALQILNVGSVQPDSDYVASERLKQRREELRRSLEMYGIVISPIMVCAEGYKLADGYCRYTTLKEMRTPRIYAYVGSL